MRYVALALCVFHCLWLFVGIVMGAPFNAIPVVIVVDAIAFGLIYRRLRRCDVMQPETPWEIVVEFKE